MLKDISIYGLHFVGICGADIYLRTHIQIRYMRSIGGVVFKHESDTGSQCQFALLSSVSIYSSYGIAIYVRDYRVCYVSILNALIGDNISPCYCFI